MCIKKSLCFFLSKKMSKIDVLLSWMSVFVCLWISSSKANRSPSKINVMHCNGSSTQFSASSTVLLLFVQAFTLSVTSLIYDHFFSLLLRFYPALQWLVWKPTFASFISHWLIVWLSLRLFCMSSIAHFFSYSFFLLGDTTLKGFMC